MDTIFALSSGRPPAGIAIIRVSGPAARTALESLAGTIPDARRARRSAIRDAESNLLDEGLVLWFPGPRTVTGEDLAEFHLHGGRAIVSAVERALRAIPGLRGAEAGEFTRRAFLNGRLDLAEAEGLADLLAAETEIQRRAAIANAGGALSRRIEAWREELLNLSAQVEAALDFSDEDDVGDMPSAFWTNLDELADAVRASLHAPSMDTLREGFRVALAGPPNAGKSTLFNALLEDEIAIATPIAGTTRDVLERSVAIDGVPITFVDMAGLREGSVDEIENIGIDRARSELKKAQLVLWLGAPKERPEQAWQVAAQIDRLPTDEGARHRVSALTGEGIEGLRQDIVEHARNSLTLGAGFALSASQRRLVEDVAAALGVKSHDLLIIGEHLRIARTAFDRLLGRTTSDEVLDTLFGRFCIGK